MPSKPSLYEILGLPNEASPDEVRRAYRELSRKHHPDLNHDPGANTRFLNIQQAYETLFDPVLRMNYDNQLDQENDDPIQMKITYSRTHIPVLDEPQIIYVHLNLSASAKFESQANPTLNLCIVLDRSTSMQGARMDTVKAAAIELIRQAQAEDILSIVTFSDRAEVLQPAERKQNRQNLETQIHLIHAKGGTEIYQGLEAGYHQIQRNLNRSMVNHILLITDGHTYGDEKACLDLANRAGTQGVRITTVGIGTEWNDEFLDEVANRTGGGSYFIAKNSDLHKVMQEQFSNMNQVFAERVNLSLETKPDIILQTAYRLQPDASNLPLGRQIRLGSILKNTGILLLLEFIVQPNQTSTYRRELAQGHLSLVLPSDASKTHDLPIRFSQLIGDLERDETPPDTIMQALTHITLYRMQEKARQEVNDGKVEEASHRLQRLATQLIGIGQLELAQTAFMEADRINQTSSLSAEGEKIMKYGTRALLLPASIQEEGYR